MAKFDSKEIKALAVGETVPVYSKEAVMAILNKIRAEIKLMAEVESEKRGYPPSSEYFRAIMKVLQIIDKYKVESDD